MRSEVDEAAAMRRAEWLAALAHALTEAHRLTGRMIRWQPASQEAVRLRVQIQAVRAQVEALRTSAETFLSAAEIDAIWAATGWPKPKHDPVP